MARDYRTQNRSLVQRTWLVMLVLCIGTAAPTLHAAMVVDLTQLSLEDLMRIEFSTLARRQQRISDTAAAVFVITPEDIRRSGATSIPEALRMVPGVEVARVGADRWAVSARGFNSEYSNKLLVLMDGRTVYNALNTGVYWNVEDTLLEDVARIEVVRGPGASLWGANAVNGVINIVTQPAEKAQGGLVRAAVGTEERFLGAARYGGAIGASAHYSAFVKYDDRDGTINTAGDDTNDAWDLSRGAGRVDWQVSQKDALTFQADVYNSASEIHYTWTSPEPPFEQIDEDGEYSYEGFNLSGRWQRTFSTDSELILQTYYSRTEYEFTSYSERLDIYDIDMQHRFSLTSRQELLWGLNYRINYGETASSPVILFDPEESSDQLFSLFVQDDISLVPARLSLILGSKFEHNEFTGWEVQPNVRLLWTPHHQHSFWAAVSRAVRTPSRFERNTRTNLAVPDYPGLVASIFANKNLASEELTAYEAGYRFLPGKRFGVDLAWFYNVYDKVVTWDSGEFYYEDPPGRLVLPQTLVNGIEGVAYGAEAALTWQTTDWWRLQGAYSYLQMDLKDRVNDIDADFIEGKSPEHQLSLRSTMDFSHGVELDVWLKYVDALTSSTQQVPAYWSMDVRIGWQATPNWSFDLVGQNLFEEHHQEFVSDLLGVPPAEIERGAYVKATWRF